MKEKKLTDQQKAELTRCLTGNFEKFKMTGYLGEVEFTLYDKKDEYMANSFDKSKGCILTPRQIAVYDMIFGAQMHSNWDMFNNCRDIFRNNWPNEYMILID